MVWVDCEPLPIDENETVVPYIDDGCLMVPLRCVAEVMGYEVIWYDEQPDKVQVGHLSFYEDGDIATFEKPVLKKSAYPTDRPAAEMGEWDMPKPAVIADGRMFVPVRALAELCGYKLSWDQERRTAAMQLKTKEDIMKIEPYFRQEGDSVTVGVTVENLTGFDFTTSVGSPGRFEVFTVKGEKIYPTPEIGTGSAGVLTYGIFYADSGNGPVLQLENLQPGEYYAKVRMSEWVEAYGNRSIRILDKEMTVPFTVR